MIVTLHLISVNVYNSVNAPANRGFSYIEVWMFGAHCPIFMALFEYGIVLYLKKIASPSDSGSKEKLDEKREVDINDLRELLLCPLTKQVLYS